MRIRIAALMVFAVIAGMCTAGAQDKAPRSKPAAKADPAKVEGAPSTGLRLDSALVTLIEQVDVPARDIGVIEKLNVKEGDLIGENDLLAQVEDKDAVLARTKAKIEADIAREEAKNDTKVRAAGKTRDLAMVELRRAQEAVEKYRNSVPPAELDRLQLTTDRAGIDIEQAEHELRAHKLTLQLKENEQALAEHNVQKRKITAPLAGMIVQVHKHAGEWVQPGDKVFRVLRLNRLRVEGFLSRNDVEAAGVLVGRPVNLSVTIAGKVMAFAGKVVHVHPEINPLNGQMRIWAEVENRDLLLKPGMQGTLAIDTAPPEVAQLK